jgi:hypothetical protein
VSLYKLNKLLYIVLFNYAQEQYFPFTAITLYLRVEIRPVELGYSLALNPLYERKVTVIYNTNIVLWNNIWWKQRLLSSRNIEPVTIWARSQRISEHAIKIFCLIQHRNVHSGLMPVIQPTFTYLLGHNFEAACLLHVSRWFILFLNLRSWTSLDFHPKNTALHPKRQSSS